MFRQILSTLLCIAMMFSFSAISFAENGSSAPQAGDHVFFGQYEQDNDLKNGPEPIEWLVLEDDGESILLLSRYCLASMP